MTTTSKSIPDRISINSHPKFDLFEGNVYAIVSDNVEIPVWARRFNNIIEEQLIEELNK
jgi:hypothetical protein